MSQEGFRKVVDLRSAEKKQLFTMCLVMIVKDEEDTIEKCLKSVAPYISYWVIVDTGSSDGTISKINSVMEELGIPGELHEREWVNFEVNRTESLRLSKNKCDYRWIIDADDEFIPMEGINPFAGIPPEADSFQLLYKLNQLQFYRAQIVKSDQDWVYKGVLHEFLELPGKSDVVFGRLETCHVKADISPLKRASSTEEKYANDAIILEEALKKEPQNTRYAFYLAQSYRDSGQLEKSIEAYQKRCEMGGWEEEVYYSLFMIAKIKEKLGRDIDEVISSYSKAWEYRPQRMEAVFHVMRILRSEKRFVLAFTYGNTAVRGGSCNDILFLEKEIWDWRFLDEYSLAAFFTGNTEMALEILKPLVEGEMIEKIPQNERERILKNYDQFITLRGQVQKQSS